MKYLKLFKENADYQSFLGGGEYVEPHVAVIEGTNTVHYKSIPEPVRSFYLETVSCNKTDTKIECQLVDTSTGRTLNEHLLGYLNKNNIDYFLVDSSEMIEQLKIIIYIDGEQMELSWVDIQKTGINMIGFVHGSETLYKEMVFNLNTNSYNYTKWVD